MNKFFENLFTTIVAIFAIVITGIAGLFTLYVVFFPVTIPITLLVIIILIIAL